MSDINVNEETENNVDATGRTSAPGVAATDPAADTSVTSTGLVTNMSGPNTKPTDVTFFFRKNSDKDSPDFGTKRDNVILALPYVTFDGLLSLLTDAKSANYIIDVVNAEIKAAARVQVDDDTSPVSKQEQLDLSKLDFKFIANQPASERASAAISKETWEAFGNDYLTVMPEITQKTEQQLQNAVAIYKKKFAPIKTAKGLIQQLKDQLALYISKTAEKEEFASIYEYLDTKASDLLKADEATLLSNI